MGAAPQTERLDRGMILQLPQSRKAGPAPDGPDLPGDATSCGSPRRIAWSASVRAFPDVAFAVNGQSGVAS